MATIADSGNFIRVTEDNGQVTDINKDDIKYSCKGNEIFMSDSSGSYIRLSFSSITSPVTANIYALRNAITALIT